jgi:hypothetical protein
VAFFFFVLFLDSPPPCPLRAPNSPSSHRPNSEF